MPLQRTKAVFHGDTQSNQCKGTFILLAAKSYYFVKVDTKPVEIMGWDACVDKFGENICKLNYFVAADSADPINYIGAPLLCAEHGSVTMRAIQGPVFDGYHQFQAGDYNVGAIGAHNLNGEMWEALEKMM